MPLEGIDISLNIQNNRDYPQQINVMGNPSNLLDTANATTEYRWNITAFSFTNENSVSIQYKAVNTASFSAFTALLPSNDINGVISALNELKIGYFNSYVELGITYIGTYNQNYVFGDLNIFSSVAAPTQGVNTNFVVGTGFVGSVYCVAADTLGNAIVGGATTNYKGNLINALAKIDTAGTLDAVFNANTLISLSIGQTIQAVVLQSDGKIILGGAKNPVFLRLNADGTNDSSFITGANFNYSLLGIPDITTLFLQSDGKILVGGDFDSYNGNVCVGLSRINNDGTFDAILNIGTGFNDSSSSLTGVNVVAGQSDGKILVGGTFDSFNGSAAYCIIRLNTDGTVDGTFNIGTGFNDRVDAIAIQTDGKILIGGYFTSYNGTAAMCIIRLNTDGTVDGTFVYGTGFDDTVKAIQIQTNGQILIGGYFSTYKGLSYLNIIRLNNNGTVDTAWSIGGFDGDVDSIAINSSTIYCVGTFSLFNGISQIKISNLYI